MPATDKETRSDSILEARTNIQEEFGFRAYNQLGVNLQDRLVHTESFWLSAEDGGDALTFVNGLYAALQSILSLRLSDKSPSDLKDSEFIDTAIKKTVTCGLGTLPKGYPPLTLQKLGKPYRGWTKSWRLRHRVSTSKRRRYPTLHRGFAAKFLTEHFGSDQLESARATNTMNKKDIDELHKAAYSTIKTLLEI